MEPDTDDEKAIAAYRLLHKFHRETDCGRDGMHWAECERLVYAYGFLSWRTWDSFVRNNYPELTPQQTERAPAEAEALSDD